MLTRLDQKLYELKLVSSRSQASNYIKLGYVLVNEKIITRPGVMVDNPKIKLNLDNQYVSRAALKLDSVSNKFQINFKEKIMLDVGSSTGGFTDYALQHGVKKVIAVDVGTNQLHSSLRLNPKVILYEKTDIRNFNSNFSFDLILIDVSFISLKNIMFKISQLANKKTLVIAMVKPQFETVKDNLRQDGVVKNDTIRRHILKDFENFISKNFKIINKADSLITGQSGNLERFYLLQLIFKN